MIDRYTPTAIALHWLIALLIFAAFPLGLYMHDLPLSPTKLRLYSYHKWIGVTIFMLAIFRLWWRARHPTPALPLTMKKWEKIAAHATHHSIYLLLIIIPLSGWLMSSAKGFQTVWFGVLPLPDLVGKNKELAATLETLHIIFNFTLLALVVAHIGAAIKHHYAERDDILTRMLPFLQKRS